jgi:SAM-dependent methyltransferase
MQMKLSIKIIALSLALLILSACDKQSSADAQSKVDAKKQVDSKKQESIYETRIIHSPDGIGKFYMQREIAQVMGHLGAGWLERPEREKEERPDVVIKAMNLKPSDVVADIGAGTGYFSFRIAPFIAQGKVLAVDIQPEMLEFLNEGKREKKISNVDGVLGTIENPNLPENSVDAALMVDAYHEFSHPREMMMNLVKSLKAGGRVVLIEYRGEDDDVPIKPLHKMTEAQVKKEMAAVGLVWRETKTGLPWQHIFVFEKPTSEKSTSEKPIK